MIPLIHYYLNYPYNFNKINTLVNKGVYFGICKLEVNKDFPGNLVNTGISIFYSYFSEAWFGLISLFINGFITGFEST